MMKRLSCLFLFLSLTAIFSSCKKDNNDWTPPRSGDYFTCLINGERFETEGSFNCSGDQFSYYPAGTAGMEESYLLFKGRICNIGKSVAIRMSGVEPFTGTLNMVESTLVDSCFPYVWLRADQFYEQLQSGTLIVEEFTPRQPNNGPFGNFEGTFEFVVSNDTLDSVIHITEGQFRFRVPNIW
ncbi:hypothetical protein G3O08_19100 [Cryomorpha ignava]|uniref:Uncharacterized protein n=1 Tax=Cryomorpha ignava TaxID=101383 RepID=A0A7K3WVS3_9FLAO|nr:hypothetical protein [Cryomorpha ignava]NEN25604.1 hypothetical protein [Cryomorpha ignava]